MKTILALIDFSDVTPKVLDHALALARACGSEIILVHVVPPDPVVVDFAPVPVSVDQFHGRQQDLMALRDSLAARGVKATTHQFSGPVVETTLANIKAFEPDLVIMGSHGHGALYNLIVGSVTEGIIKHADWPVMVVPSSPAPQTQPVTSSTNGKEQSERTTQLIGALGGSLFPP